MLYTKTLIARTVEITEAKQTSNEYGEAVIFVIQRWALVSTDLTVGKMIKLFLLLVQ